MGASGTYELAIAIRARRVDCDAMKKRTLAALLWFYAAWYGGAMVAHVLGLSPVLGPILGTAAAAIVAGDPRRLIWSRTPIHDDRAASRPASQGRQLA